MNQTAKKPRGRPKTLDRAQVLQTAVLQYWQHGPEAVSINDICALVQASKPGVYREFGNDDGLKSAALTAYRAVSIDPFLALLDAKRPPRETLDSIVAYLLQDRESAGIPKGCLFVSMRAQRNRLGPETLKCLEDIRGDFLNRIKIWILALQEKGHFSPRIPAPVAAHQLDALHTGAMRMQCEDMPPGLIEDVIRYGFMAAGLQCGQAVTPSMTGRQ